MSANGFQPRRLRDSTASAGTVAWRLAHQLQLLSTSPRVPPLRPSLADKARGRFLLIAVRVAVVALILLVVMGGASASAFLLIRKIYPPASTPEKPSPSLLDQEVRPHANRARTAGSPEPQPEPLPPAQSPSAPAVVRPVADQAPPSRGPRAVDESASRPTAPAGSAPPSPARRLASREPSAETGLAPSPSPSPAGSAPSAKVQLAAHEDATSPPLTPPEFPATIPSGAMQPGPSRGSARPTPATTVPTDGIAEEAALLRQALSALRQSDDPRRALALLDSYPSRFPHGTLTLEASVARAQALLGIDDKPAALAILDGLPLEQGSQAGELRLMRGELRVQAGRCKEALLDFDEVLRRGGRPEDSARARAGQAACRTRTGADRQR